MHKFIIGLKLVDESTVIWVFTVINMKLLKMSFSIVPRWRICIIKVANVSKPKIAIHLRREWIHLRREWIHLRREWIHLRREWIHLRREWGGGGKGYNKKIL
jgi:hypothetical protein